MKYRHKETGEVVEAFRCVTPTLSITEWLIRLDGPTDRILSTTDFAAQYERVDDE